MSLKKDTIQKNRVCVITFPPLKAGLTPLSNLIDILTSSSDEVYLITGNAGYYHFTDNKNIHLYGIFHSTGNSSVNRIKNYICTQFKIACLLLKIINKVDICIFSWGGKC